MALIIIAAVVYRQYKVFRVPVTDQELSQIDTSKLDQKVAEDLLKDFELAVDELIENGLDSVSDPTTDSIREFEITNGVKHSIPLNEIVGGGPPKDGIPSIDNPKFESVRSADQYLDDDGFGLAVEVNGKHRFYPYQVIVWHEIVNDNFNGKPLLVTYCPLCFTGIVFEPTVKGESVEFGTSGKLYNSNLLMYDRKTDSLWSQALGEAVVGEMTGTELVHYPALTTSWREWKDAHPDSEVLSRNTGALRDYTRDPYGSYYTNPSIWFPLSNTDSRLPSKELIFGIRVGDARKAYAEKDVIDKKVINDEVGGTSVLALFDSDLSAIRIFNRTVNGQVLTFELKDGELVDITTESTWSFDGKATSGSLQGSQLDVIVHENSFWFSWAASFPETELYQP